MEIVEDFVSWTRLMPSKHFNPFIHYFSIFLTQYSRPTILITPHPEQEEQRREQGGFNKELPQLLFAHNSSISAEMIMLGRISFVRLWWRLVLFCLILTNLNNYESDCRPGDLTRILRREVRMTQQQVLTRNQSQSGIILHINHSSWEAPNFS